MEEIWRKIERISENCREIRGKVDFRFGETRSKFEGKIKGICEKLEEYLQNVFKKSGQFWVVFYGVNFLENIWKFLKIEKWERNSKSIRGKSALVHFDYKILRKSI